MIYRRLKVTFIIAILITALAIIIPFRTSALSTIKRYTMSAATKYKRGEVYFLSHGVSTRVMHRTPSAECLGASYYV